MELIASKFGLSNVEVQRKFQIGRATAIVDAFSESDDEVILLEVNARVGSVMKTATIVSHRVV